MHYLMQAVPTAPLLIFSLVFLLYCGDIINVGKYLKGGCQEEGAQTPGKEECQAVGQEAMGRNEEEVL